MAGPIVEMKDISFRYDEKPIVEHIDFNIPRGSFIGLIGPNGGGKTTLVKMLFRLLLPDEGEINLFGKPVREFKEWNRIGYVSQKANAFNSGFPATVYEVVAMGLTAKIGYGRFFRKKHEEKVLQAIGQVGMSEYARQNVGQLSGGQQQRVFIARALVSEPEVLILDEPTVGVDTENIRLFYELLHRLHKEHNLTLLLVTHDTETMTQYATDIACINQRLHFHGKPEDFDALSGKDMQQIYGHAVTVMTHQHL